MKRILGLILVLINMGAAAYDNTQGKILNDLEFYINTLNCIQKYIYCNDTLKVTNKSLDCLQYSQCEHMSTLQALINLPYMQNQVLNLQQNNAISQLLITYGKNNLEQFIESVSNVILNDLINDLVTNLNGNDLKTLTAASARPVPPTNFNG